MPDTTPPSDSSDNEWVAYRERFESLSDHIARMAIVRWVAAPFLEDFPRRLPGNFVEIWNDVEADIETAFGNLEEPPEGGERAVDVIYDLDNPQSRIAATFQFFLRAIQSYRRSAAPGFEDYLLAQELVMLFAEFDAFLTDSLETSVRREPRLLASKKMKVADLSASSERDLDELIGRFLYNFGMKGLPDRIRYLRERLDLPLASFPDDLVPHLWEMELRRHCIVHNSGRLSRRYIDKHAPGDAKVGDKVDLSETDLFHATNLVRRLTSSVFEDVSVKFFGVTPDREVVGLIVPIHEPTQDPQSGRDE